MRTPFSLLTLLCSALSLSAATLYIDDLNGSDQNTGTEEAPLATIQRAVALAKPGDEIRLRPAEEPLRQPLHIANRSGEPGKPIIFDGGGRTLIGTGPLDPAEWEEVRPGVYRSTQFLGGQLKTAKNLRPVGARVFMVFDGKVQNMGLRGKLRRPALPKPEDLKPGEWTLAEEERAFYLAIDPSQKLADAKVELPYFQNGVATRGDVQHWVIRNVTVRRFMNDGFNFHGKSNDLVLEDVAAYECSDDGMSAHGECRIIVRRFVAEGNATGICHVDNAFSENEEVTLRNNIGTNLYLLGTGTHTFARSKISTLGNGVVLGGGKPEKVVTVKFTDTEFEGKGTPEGTYRVQAGSEVEILP